MAHLVSIVVPVYNVEKYLEKCVDSLINQTYEEIEIILVDDGSTDSSGNLCDELSQKDKRIIVIHKKNGGLSDARNVGIENATGGYLLFVDSDDWIEINTIKDSMESINKDEVDVVVFGIAYDDENGTYKTRSPLINGTFSGEKALIYLNTFRNINESACNKLYRRTLFSDIKFPVGKKNEDCYTIYKVLDKASKVSIIQKPFYHYFNRRGSITRNAVVNMDCIYAACEQRQYIINKYPKYKYIGDTLLAFTYLIVSIQKYQRGYQDKGMEEVRNGRKLTCSVLKNKYLSNSRKIQYILWAYLPHLYRKIMVK